MVHDIYVSCKISKPTTMNASSQHLGATAQGHTTVLRSKTSVLHLPYAGEFQDDSVLRMCRMVSH